MIGNMEATEVRKIKFFQGSLYRQLLLIFLCLLVPIQCLGVIIMRRCTDALLNEIRQSAQSNAQFVMRTLDERLKSVEVQLDLLLTDITIRKVYAQAENNGAYWLNLRDTVNRLNLVCTGNPYLDEIRLYYPVQGLVVSSRSSITELDEPEAYRRLALSVAQRGVFSLDDGPRVTKMYPATAYYLERSENNQPLIIAQARLSQSMTVELLSLFADQTALVDLTHGLVLTSDMGQSATILADARSLRDAGLSYRSQGSRHLVCAESGYAGYCLMQYVSEGGAFAKVDRFSWYYFLFTLLSIPVVVLYSMMAYHLVKKPVDALVKGFAALRHENFHIRLEIPACSQELDILTDNFNRTAARLQELIDTVYKQEVYTKAIELKQLQSQINPHFLYNSFFALKHLVQDEDCETAELLANHLAEYFQYITRTGNTEVPLTDEYHHALSYLNIQSIRFAGKVDIRVQPLPQRLSGIMVPRLIIQPLLENAFSHGIHSSATAGIVSLGCDETDGLLRIAVEDSGRELDDNMLYTLCEALAADDQPLETTGLVNIHRRLRLRYGLRSGLRIGRAAIGGMRAELNIDLMNKGVNNNAVSRIGG